MADSLDEDLRTLTICWLIQEEKSVFLEVIMSITVVQKSWYEHVSRIVTETELLESANTKALW